MNRIRQILSSKHLLMLLLLPLTFAAKGQSLEPNYGAPATSLNVANGTAVFKIRINGGSSACAGPQSLTLSLPVGYVYVAGSASVSAGLGSVSETSSSANTASLSVTGIPASPDSTIISYSAYAGCGVIGGSANTISYNLDGCAGPATATASVNAQNAQLNITSVTNNAYVGAVGDTYSRVITISNDGLGSIDTLYLNSINTGGISVTGYVAGSGTITATPNGYRIVAPTADGHFDNAETITITETVSINTCTSGSTSFESWYGPGGIECTSVSNAATAGASVATGAPNLVFGTSAGYNHNLACSGEAFDRRIYIANTGTGAMYNLSINLFGNGTASGANDLFSATQVPTRQRLYEISSIKYKIGSGGAITSLTTDSIKNYTTAAACASSDFAGALFVTIPSVPAGDTVWLEWVDKNCCEAESAYCTNGATYANSRVKYKYRNACGVVTTTQTYQLRSAGYTGFSTTPSLPGSIVAGEEATFIYDIPYAENQYNGSSTIKLSWQFPVNLQWSGDASDIVFTRAAGTTITPLSVNYNAVTKLLEVTFNNSGSTNMGNFNAGQIVMNGVTTDCTAGTTGNGNIDFTSQLIQGGCTSGCTVTFQCLSSSIFAICDFPCPDGGMVFKNFKSLRSSYGAPDNDNDRNADASGVVDLSKIRRDFIFTGDTVCNTFTGIISVTGASPTFIHGYAKVSPQSPSNFENLYADLKIYRAGMLVVNAANYPTSTDMTIDFSPDTLAAHGYSGYSFTDGDSVVVNHYMKTIYSSASDGIRTISNRFYLSDIFNPTDEADRYSCIDSIPQTLSYTGLNIWNNNPSKSIFASGCDTIFATPSEYVSIRSNNTNNLSVNAFAYEFRQTANLDTILVANPVGYEFGSLVLTIQRRNGTGTSANVLNLTPVDASAATWVFAVPSDSVTASDETKNISIRMGFVPACDAPASVIANISTIYRAAPGYPDQSVRRVLSGNWTLNYTAAEVNATASAATVTSSTDTAVWVVQLANATGSVTAKNVWLAKEGISGLNIEHVERLSGPSGSVLETITPSGGGIYQLDTLAGGANRYYKITATTTNCSGDSIQIAYGRSCFGYPTSVAAASCKDTLKLGVIQQKPALQLAITAQPSGTVDLCDILDYEIEVTNSGLGAAGNLSVRMVMPSTGGIEYVPGSYGIKYPSTAGSYTSLADGGAAIVGGNMVFTIPASELASLPGTGKFKIKFQLKTTPCDFTSGSRLVFRPAGRNGCNAVILGTAVAGNRVNLNGVPPIVPAFTLSSSATSVVACGSGSVSSDYKFKLINTGSIATAATDGYRITLPSGWSMNTAVTYSTAPPAGGAYSMSPATGVYDFYTGVGLAVGDSIVFTTTLSADAAAQSCGLTEPIVESGFVEFTATCIDPATTCNSKQLLEPENATTTINVQRPEYSIASIDLDEAATAAGSNVIGSLTLTHDNAVYTAQDVTISVYEDLNSNGTYDAGEPLLGSESYAVGTGASQVIAMNIPTTITTPSTKNLVAVATFECACDTPQVSLLNVVLPIIFSDEKIASKECSVNLSWNYSASDVTVYSFNVERKGAREGNWQAVASIPATQLSYTDEVPSAGQWLYRIKAINSNNEQAYSRILQANTTCDNGSVTVFPNPASTECYIMLEGKDNDKVPYTVTDKLGRVVLSGELSGNSKNKLSLDQLASGIYHIQFVYGNQQYVKAIDVVK